ncbi:hypothetical protein [Microbacterium sp. NPDC055683]
MLTPLPAPDRRRRAYLVPWDVDRADPDHPRVRNAAKEPADLVRVFVHDETTPPSIEHWGLVLPGEVCELCLCDRDLSRTIVSVAWFRADDGEEYLWRFVL